MIRLGFWILSVYATIAILPALLELLASNADRIAAVAETYKSEWSGSNMVATFEGCEEGLAGFDEEAPELTPKDLDMSKQRQRLLFIDLDGTTDPLVRELTPFMFQPEQLVGCLNADGKLLPDVQVTLRYVVTQYLFRHPNQGYPTDAVVRVVRWRDGEMRESQSNRGAHPIPNPNPNLNPNPNPNPNLNQSIHGYYIYPM